MLIKVINKLLYYKLKIYRNIYNSFKFVKLPIEDGIILILLSDKFLITLIYIHIKTK